VTARLRPLSYPPLDPDPKLIARSFSPMPCVLTLCEHGLCFPVASLLNPMSGPPQNLFSPPSSFFSLFRPLSTPTPSSSFIPPLCFFVFFFYSLEVSVSLNYGRRSSSLFGSVCGLILSLSFAVPLLLTPQPLFFFFSPVSPLKERLTPLDAVIPF